MPRPRAGLCLLAGVAGLVLLALAAPRFAAGVIAGPLDATVRAVGRGEIAPDSRWLPIAAASREHAYDWYADPRYAADLGALAHARAQALPRASGERTALIETASAADRLALSRAPSQPFSWTRLAQAKLEHDGAGADIAALLAMSFRTAPADPRLVLPRLEIAFAVWERLPDPVREQVREQIGIAMAWYPKALVDMAARRYRQAVVRESFADDPVMRTRFNIMYLRRRQSL